MAEERFITLAIHTYNRAIALRKVLESHGIEVRFEKLNIGGAAIASGIRVKIEEHDLPLALKLMESGEAIPAAKVELRMEGTKGNILIPVDFSSYSVVACKAGFALARQLMLHPVLLYAYATPYFTGSLGYADTFDEELAPSMDNELVGLEMSVDIRKESDRRMRKFRQTIKEMQKNGELPEISFSTSISEGVAEDVIKEYCRLTPPALVVMATRGKDKRDEQLIGSVAAEVIDSCRVPVYVLPENYNFTTVSDVKKVAYFCNLDQQDILSVDTLMRTFDYPEVEVVLIPVNDRAGNSLKEKVDLLKDYFNKSYPAAHFTSEVFPLKELGKDFENYAAQTHIDLQIVPNKKQNIFRRLFNPGIAHKLLFDRDLPLLALPV
ncbi:MAG: universal stress protein [Muribaculaceae bacterium]|nr:universal stress protein [Muribaculaceae bacterium]